MALQAWTGQAPGQTDPDSPGDTTLMDSIRTDLAHLRQVVYGNGSGGFNTPIDGHNHNGTNSVKVQGAATGTINQDAIGASAVGQGELKTSSGPVSTALARQSLTLPGGIYGFYPRTKMSTTASGSWLANIIANDIANGSITNQIGWTTYASIIQLGAGAGGTIFAEHVFITASPPYKVGNADWNHFMFLLREINSEKVLSAYEAECPPWQYNGKTWLPKDHKDRLETIPHPFVDYWDKDPADDGLEIVLVDLNEVDVIGWRESNHIKGKCTLEDIQAVLPGKGTSHHVKDIGVPDIARFSERVKIVTP